MRIIATALAWALTALTVFGLAASAQAPAPPAKRIALVVGNGGYALKDWFLPNPPNDAALIAARLRALRFSVVELPNADRAKLTIAMAQFGARIQAGGNDTVAVFYYAGHGAQLDETNYLIPVDNTAATLDDLLSQSPPMQRLFGDMARAGNRVNIIVLDACRDVPALPRKTSAPIQRPGFPRQIVNVLISYSTLNQTRATDGGGKNSPFTKALAERLRVNPAQPVALLFAGLNSDVDAATKGRQSASFLFGLKRAEDFNLSPAGQTVLQAALPSRKSVADEPTSDKLGRPAPARGIGAFRDCELCPEMVTIPAGEIRLGRRPGDGYTDSGPESPLIPVRIASFALGRFEVTRGEWAAFVNATSRPDPQPDCEVLIGEKWTGMGTWREPYIDQEDNHPAVCISWNDARDYVAWLSARTGKNYRLMSEAEFEYAARAGTETRYYWGHDASPEYVNYRGSNVAGTTPVGSYQPNPFGLYDILGNASEWTADYLSRRETVVDGKAVDPCPPPEISECYRNTRMNRGGSWEADDNVLRVSFRNGNLATVRYSALGLRVAREL